jgi:hypothetical protein
MAQTLELELDEQTMARARQITSARGQSLEAYLTDVVRQLGRRDTPGETGDPYLGMFADDAGLINQLVASAMDARERQPLRHAGTR